MLIHPDHLRYTPHHVWVDLQRQQATIGLSEDLQHEIEAVISIDLPMVDDELEMDVECMAVHLPDGDLHHLSSPLTGRVIEVNEEALDEPEIIFLSPYKKGWLFKMEYDEPDEVEMLMSSDEYAVFLEEAEG